MNKILLKSSSSKFLYTAFLSCGEAVDFKHSEIEDELSVVLYGAVWRGEDYTSITVLKKHIVAIGEKRCIPACIAEQKINDPGAGVLD